MTDHPKAEMESASSTTKYSAPKDKGCPFCGQTFTSSSLGRHLDLYIRERNPKAPDGVHHVDDIRRMRSGITRRLPRSSFGAKKDPDTPTSTSTSVTATPAATPHAGGGGTACASSGRDGDGVSDSSSATPGIGIGIMHYIPQSRPEGQPVGDKTRKRAGSPGAASQSSTVPPAGSKQVLKRSQLELRAKLVEAMDRANASELALREVLSSWRAAKQHVDNNSMPFESSPLSLDFPALVLQFLQPPPTLFSSIQTPTPTSWSTKAPAEAECRALSKVFHDEFSRWKDGCMRATRASFEDLAQPSGGDRTAEMNEAAGRARDKADAMEAQVQEHVQAAFATWARLHQSRRDELWVLELARGVSKSRQELERHKDERHRLAQENANLKTQIEHLNRLQQPKEYCILAPATLPFERDVVNHILSEGIMGGRGSNILGEDRHMDLNTAVRKSIERWKTVVTTSRATSGGMSVQRPLNQTEHFSQSSLSEAASGCPTPLRPHAQPLAPPDRQSATNVANNVPSESQTAPPSISGGASTIDDHSDDEAVGGTARSHDVDTNDADQEMEGNETYAAVHTSRPVSIPSIKQAIDGSVPSHGLGGVDMAAPRGHPMQLQNQMQAGVAVMHEGMGASSHMQRGGDMSIMMEQARFMMQQQHENQKAHMDNLARTMPGLSNMQASLHHHQSGTLDLDIQNNAMYME